MPTIHSLGKQSGAVGGRCSEVAESAPWPHLPPPKFSLSADTYHETARDSGSDGTPLRAPMEAPLEAQIWSWLLPKAGAVPVRLPCSTRKLYCTGVRSMGTICTYFLLLYLPARTSLTRGFTDQFHSAVLPSSDRIRIASATYIQWPLYQIRKLRVRSVSYGAVP